MTAYEKWMADYPNSTIDEATFRNVYLKGFERGQTVKCQKCKDCTEEQRTRCHINMEGVNK